MGCIGWGSLTDTGHPVHGVSQQWRPIATGLFALRFRTLAQVLRVACSEAQLDAL